MMNEAETRRRLVERALANAGWTPMVDYVQGRSYEKGAIREYETDTGASSVYEKGEGDVG